MLRFVDDAQPVPPECLQVRQAAPLPVAARQVAGTQLLQGTGPAYLLEPVAEAQATTLSQRNAIQLLNKLAPEYGVSPRLAFAVVAAESNFNPTAISRKNAQGLMQLIPETAARFNVSKIFDPVQNLRGGLAYLRWLLAYFQGNVSLVLAAYNAGEGTVIPIAAYRLMRRRARM
jgi:soluble lytic murein transglycosylase-like protein